MFSWWKLKGKIKYHAFDRPVFSLSPLKSLCKRATIPVGWVGVPRMDSSRANECGECRRRLDAMPRASGDIDL
jgi:hypothetical protein